MDENERVALAVLERDFSCLDKGLAEVKAEIKEVKVELKAEIAAVRTEMQDGFQRLEKKIDSKFPWMLGALGGVVVLITGFIYFFFESPSGQS